MTNMSLLARSRTTPSVLRANVGGPRWVMKSVRVTTPPRIPNGLSKVSRTAGVLHVLIDRTPATDVGEGDAPQKRGTRRPMKMAQSQPRRQRALSRLPPAVLECHASNDQRDQDREQGQVEAAE